MLTKVEAEDIRSHAIRIIKKKATPVKDAFLGTEIAHYGEKVESLTDVLGNITKNTGKA